MSSLRLLQPALLQAPARKAPGSLQARGSRAAHQLQQQRGHRQQAVVAGALPPLVEELLPRLLDASPGLAVGAAANTAVYVAGIRVLLSGLTWQGVASSWVLGTLTYAAFGAGGYAIVCAYFIVGSLVTKVKLEQKQAEGIAEARSGRRSLGSVLGSGFAGMLCAAAALATGSPHPWQAGFVASFASKLADTTSSEIGKAYGRTTYLVTSLQRVPRGTEGAVSAEGTAAGAVAAAAVGGLALLLGQVDARGAAAVTAAAFLANLFESWLGATVQGRLPWLTNDLVNVLQISLAAALALAFVQ